MIHPNEVQKNTGEEKTPVQKKSISKAEIIVNGLLVVGAGALIALVVVFALNYDNVMFALRRPDMIDAARTVESEEQKQISQKIAEAKKETIKKILSPLVFNETK